MVIHRALALAAGIATMSIGFGPAPENVKAQLSASPPEVGIVVATLDHGRSAIESYGAPFTGDSPFEIGSITKTFTAALFADMIARGEVRADDPIERYLPAGATAPTFEGKHITLEELATQSSGLPRLPTNFAPQNAADPYADYDDAKLLAFLASYQLPRAPGASYEYSNLGYGLLGYLLARRLGTDYASAIRTRVLEPLGMTHTTLETGSGPIETVGGHDADGDPVGNWRQAALAGAGAVISTPDDMLRYAAANLDRSAGGIAAAMQDAQRPRADAGAPDRRIGYAWIVMPDGIVWHNGGTAGFRSFLGLDRANDRAIVVLSNGFIDAVDALGLNALDSTFPLPAAAQPDFAVDARVLDAYAGRYRFADGPVATVTRDARGLRISFDKPAFAARLHAVSATEFAIRALRMTIDFHVESRSASLTLVQTGQAPESAARLP